MIRNRTAIAALLVAGVLMMVGCNASQPNAAAPQGPQAAAGSTAGPQSAQPAAPAGQPTAQASAASGALPAPQVGALKSYVVDIESKVEVVKPSPSVESWTVAKKTVRNEPAPGAYSLTVEDKTGSGSTAKMQMVVAGKDGYVFTPEEQKWVKVAMDAGAGVAPFTGPVIDPDSLARDAAASVFGAPNLVSAHEQVNGVDTAHYKAADAELQQYLDKQNGAGYKLLSGQAEFWIAYAGNYVKQYRLQASVQEQKTGRELKETTQLLMSGENQPVAVATPAADQVMTMPIFDLTPAPQVTGTVQANSAQQVQADQETLRGLPLPPQGKVPANGDVSAGVLSTLGSYAAAGAVQVIYVSPASAEEIASFYKTELTRLGWSQVMSTPGKGASQPGLGLYSKGDTNLQLVILSDSATSRNVVLLQIGG